MLPYLTPEKKQFYQKNKHPFPHAVFVDVFDPDTLKEVLKEFPTKDWPYWNRYTNKWEFKLANETPHLWGPKTQKFMEKMNSAETIEWLEELTGIDNLIADPTYRGGGLHFIPEGGYLKVHIDFNRHREDKKLYRRVNVLVFLNDDWNEDEGGYFELWHPSGKHRVVATAPTFNKMAIFSTTETSYHGHPKPLAKGRERKSLALYYYTKEDPEFATDHHGTQFIPS